MSQENSKQQFLLGLFGGVAIISVVGLIILGVAFMNSQKKDGNVAGTNDNANQQQNQNQDATGPAANQATVDGVKTFSEKTGAEICKEDGKPVVYLFSTTWCPHCKWIKDTFDQTMKKYVDQGKIKAYHWEVDTNDNTLTAEKETQIPAEATKIYNEFNPQGSIPTFVFGCKYFRIGNGYEAENDLNAEVAEFDALIKELTK